MKLFSLLTVCLFASCFLSTAVSANEASKPYYYVPEVPADVSGVDFYLMTVGVGDDLAARYGHTGIRIVNPVDKTDVVFNWGKFYFDDPMFAVNFYKGDLTYSMGVRSYQRDIEHHEADRRAILQEKINLNSRQKRKLFEKIAWNARPENRDFKYQYWYKNCSTIPRDYLDEVMEGQIRAKFYRQPAGKTFRQYVRSNLSLTPGMIPVLDTIMNSRIDRPISKWEEMFLPGKLREHLLTMNSVDADGNLVPGVPLLSQSEVLRSYPEHFRNFKVDYWLFAGFVWVYLAAAVVRLQRGQTAGGSPGPDTGMRLLGAALTVFGIVSGFIGTAMLLNWLLSGHEDIWHNANLLLFTPFDWIFAVIGFRMLKSGVAVKDRFPFVRAGTGLAWLHVISFVVLGLARAGGLVEQNVNAVMLWLGLPVVVLNLLTLVHGFARAGVQAPAPAASAAGASPRLRAAKVRSRS
jgi:hypothetical protein